MQQHLETILEIKENYRLRDMKGVDVRFSEYSIYRNAVVRERQKIYTEVFKSLKPHPSEIKFLEIGAGEGYNLPYIKSLGLQWENIYVNELLENRVEAMQKRYPTPHVYPGNALDLPFDNKFDLVFQSTVFTSILSEPFRISMAKKLWNMAKDDGVILWYDFVYNNPKNPHVRKVTRDDVRRFFPEAKSIEFYPVTLAPPIGRRIGKAYGLMNALFPFLRSHLIAVIRK